MGSGDGTDGTDGGFIIKLRGLPYSTNEDEVLEFLSGVNVVNGVRGVHITEFRPGRPSGECFVEVESEVDLDLACAKDKEHMGKRYIEVFTSDRQELDWALNHSSDGNNLPPLPPNAGAVKLRGLPFGCSKDEIIQFFIGLDIVQDGISMLSDHTGRSSGEAFVIFENQYDAQAALERDREKIGHRYIEVFLSSPDDVKSFLDRINDNGGFGRGGGGFGGRGRPAPYDRPDRFGGRGPPRNFRGNSRFRGGGGGGPLRGSGGMGGGMGGGGAGGHCVHMRGLPFKASESDIAYFFKPVRPSNINILFDNNNRPSGEADVEFECHEDALRAMRKDKSNMEHRYIELFLNSSPGNRGGFARNNFRN